MVRSSLVAATALFSAANALDAKSLRRSRFPVAPSIIAKEGDTTTYNSTFEQLVDHNDPNGTTFSQRYWWNTEYWEGPGSPVVFFTPGEIEAEGYTGYLTNRTITGQFAQAIGGAVVMLEHRYWGESSPYDVLTTANLQLLNLNQSISDITYFADNIDFEFDTNKSSHPSKAPWVISGGSYSGALSAWTESTAPGTFWAYHASSAPVEAVYDYWQYFYPIQQGMAANCSKDVSLVIDYVDAVLTTGSEANKTALKSLFGLETVEHDADFADVLANGPYLWQSNAFYTGYSEFFQFCDAVENVTPNGTIPGAEGVGLELALAGYANWVNSTLLPDYCASYGYEEWQDEWSTGCFDTYNASSPLFTDTTVSNAIDRQWNWFLCNEPLAYWQDGAPENVSTITSRLVTPAYWQRQCGLFFPPDETTYDEAGLTTADVNAYTKGWELTNTTRLIWTNGEFDPWRTSGVSSQFRPGGGLESTPEHPLQIIPGGFHCSDLIIENGEVNAGVQTVIDNEIAQIKAWVAEYYEQGGSVAKQDSEKSGWLEGKRGWWKA